jgi:hypothetical protein
MSVYPGALRIRSNPPAVSEVLRRGLLAVNVQAVELAD